jgi:hypothetical protein
MLIHPVQQLLTNSGVQPLQWLIIDNRTLAIVSSYRLTSKITLNGVSAARLKCVNPAF